MAPTPDNVKGWLGAIWPILHAASPVTVMILLVLWALSLHWMTQEVQRVHTVNHNLWEQLLEAQREQIALAWRCSQGAALPRQD
jgi:hypothetical protein